MKKKIKIVLIIVIILGTINCTKKSRNNQIDKMIEQNEIKKQPKKIFEITFEIENFTNTILGDDTGYSGSGLKLNINNISKGIEKINLKSLNINGESEIIVTSKTSKEIMDFPAENAFITIMPNEKEEIWVKLFKKDEKKKTETNIKYPAYITLEVEEIITNTYYVQDIIINEEGKVLYENLRIKNYKSSLESTY